MKLLFSLSAHQISPSTPRQAGEARTVIGLNNLEGLEPKKDFKALSSSVFLEVS